MARAVHRSGLVALGIATALMASCAFAAKDVVVAVGSNFTTLDPYDANDTLSQAVAKSFYQGLFGLDKEMKLKNVLAEDDGIGSLVFDEVDTGVSGRAAQKVAEKLAQVSRRKQVLCVTHLPQLAAMADTHFSVEKGEQDGRTYTRVVLLDREQRKAELARITGGSRVTEALLASAGELLDQAERYRSELGMRNHAE